MTPEKNIPDLFGIDYQIERFYALQQRFLFFYLDLLEIERAYPVIADQHYVHIQNQIAALEGALLYNIERGSIKKEDPKSMHHLAEQLWFTAVFWPRQARVRGVVDSLAYMRQTLWRQILPYLTDQGKTQLDDILKSQSTQQFI